MRTCVGCKRLSIFNLASTWLDRKSDPVRNELSLRVQ